MCNTHGRILLLVTKKTNLIVPCFILNHPLLGFYDTSEEVVKPLDPNFKRLRQDQMDEKRRDDVEEVGIYPVFGDLSLVAILS